MRRSVLLALAAAALVAAPQAWADEQHSSQGHEPSHEQKGGQHPAQGQHPGPGPQGQAQGQHGWGGQPHGQGQGHAQGQGQGQGQGQNPHGWGAQPQGQPQGRSQGQRTWNGQAQGGWNGRPGGAVQQGERGRQAGRWNGQAEQRFDRRTNPGGWGQTRNSWRGAHPGWDRSAPWRQNHDWWRGRPAFRGFTGPRVGFWFIPGVGYYQVPREYWGRHWAYGDYLPRIFWQYQVDDWSDYDLPPPPWGTAWVWIDGGVALVDLSDGYILDVEYGLW